ncbi:alcohol dehydrogenase [Kitasatospora herbaricolor]|uniref:zinc-binding dehydrogenase n=1 Tax=Kitasatospora herbaricolor TaxID=68217 RepID=UPI0017497DAB|nr:zinc-binding dehydrogenase [Kitasatospora herbaricolor]MDQ0312875.1 NADPH:quinone reductase-like Zn-dependent oxidoreductase [Kitasatospora herbaricolor]GGV35774.1 alcohol dehydrogenase [Kitasatospora herbaricolor]
MKAIVISAYGGPEMLRVTDLPDPVPAQGEVLIRVKAFGLNHAEAYMRAGAWGDVAAVPGIECAGLVEADPSGRLAPGTRVVAILGGMGRTRNGSYAELVTVPAGNVAAVDSRLDWAELAAVPEVYATAWNGLFGNLGMRPGERVLVRGATSSLGQAAVNLAVAHGASVLATTRNPAHAPLLKGLGAEEVLIDDGYLAAQVGRGGLVVDAVFDLVGNNALRDSLAVVRPRGRVCQLGFLGGFEPVRDFDPITDLPSGVQLSFFGSAFVLGSSEFPLADVPLDAIYAQVESGALAAGPVRTFRFGEIVEAHRVLEAGAALGKMTVTVD